jgi:hypothetical protein
LNAMPDEPLPQRFQIFGEGGECSFDNFQLFAAQNAGADENALFVHVQTGAAAIYYFHRVSSAASAGRNGKTMTFLRVLSRLAAEATIRCAVHN